MNKSGVWVIVLSFIKKVILKVFQKDHTDVKIHIKILVYQKRHVSYVPIIKGCSGLAVMNSWVRSNPSVLKMGKGTITFCTKTRISTSGNSSIRVADEVPDLIK